MVMAESPARLRELLFSAVPGWLRTAAIERHQRHAVVAKEWSVDCSEHRACLTYQQYCAWMKATDVLALLADPPAANDGPGNTDGRLLLNAYGRQCFDAGMAAEKTRAAAETPQGWQGVGEPFDGCACGHRRDHHAWGACHAKGCLCPSFILPATPEASRRPDSTSKVEG